MKIRVPCLVVLVCALPAYCAELKPLPDLKSPAGVDKKHISKVEDTARSWWLRRRGLLAEESVTVAGYFSVARPIAEFADRNDRVWEIRVVHIHTGGPTGILWVNDKNGRIIGLGVEEKGPAVHTKSSRNLPVAEMSAKHGGPKTGPTIPLDEFGSRQGNKEDPVFQSIGWRLKPFCKYEMKETNLDKLCRDLKAEQITFDEFFGVDVSKLDPLSRLVFQRGTPGVTPSPDEVIRFFRSGRIVASHDWQHKYHHVANVDQYGYLTTCEGTKIIWMLRPGGLGVLVYPDGGTIFLAAQ